MKLTKKIATIDIETLSLARNAVIFEIGIVVTEEVPTPGTLWKNPLDFPNNSSLILCNRISLELSSQKEKGRLIDDSTMEFHRNNYKALGSDFDVYLKHAELTSLGAEGAFGEIRSMLTENGVKEVWMNHTHFDHIRLESYFEDFALGMPWMYNQAYDVATAIRIYRNKLSSTDIDQTRFEKTEFAHTSIADCLWNLSVLSASGALSVRGEST